MINLIPNQEKKKKVKDFYFRLGVVFIATIGSAVFITVIAILPSYFVSRVEKNLAEEKLQAVKNEPVPAVDEESLRAMQDLDHKLDLLEKQEKENYIVSQKTIQEIILKKMPDIKIYRISYSEDTKGKEIKIYGIATSRERLLLFRRALEDDPSFKKVDLPISNFIKGSNIEFYLNLTPA